MKISENSVNLGQQVYAKELEATQSPEVNKVETNTDDKKTASSDRVSLSANARDMQVAQNAVEATPDIREEAVQDLKKEVDSGTYEVDSGKIADKIIGSNIDQFV